MYIQIPNKIVPLLRELQASQTETLDGEDAVVMTLGLGDAMYLTFDGRIMISDFLENNSPREAESLAEIASAIVIGAKVRKCPELLSLLPPRPNNSVDCELCNKSGWSNFGSELMRFICDECGGLGWKIKS